MEIGMSDVDERQGRVAALHSGAGSSSSGAGDAHDFQNSGTIQATLAVISLFVGSKHRD